MASPGPHCLLPCKRPVNASSSHTGMLNWTRWTCGFYVLNFLCNRGNVEHQKYFVSIENSNILKLIELFLLIFNPSFSFPFHTLLLLPLTRIVPHSLPAVCENVVVSPTCFTSIHPFSFVCHPLALSNTVRLSAYMCISIYTVQILTQSHLTQALSVTWEITKML